MNTKHSTPTFPRRLAFTAAVVSIAGTALTVPVSVYANAANPQTVQFANPLLAVYDDPDAGGQDA